jgi:putative oxidoreductase
MIKWLNSLQPFGALILRLVLGAAMLYYGWDKVIPSGGLHAHSYTAALEHHAHFVASLGIPYWLGYVSALTEFLGGIFLLVGLLTRFTAFLVAVNMAVALLWVNRHHGYAGSEYSLALFAIALMLLFYGAGALALDRRFRLA